MDLGTNTLLLSSDNPPRKEHPFLMYDSIRSAPRALQVCLLNRPAVRAAADEFRRRGVRQVILTGCGTSLNAGRGLAYAFEQLAGLPARVIDSLEVLLYPPAGLDETCALIAVSHSGNALPTVQAAQLANQRGALTVALSGNPEGKLAAEARLALIDPAGQELPRPKTRSYLVTCFQGLQLAAELGGALAEELAGLPGVCQAALDELDRAAQAAATNWGASAQHFMIAGSGAEAGNAAEIALKIMETIGKPAAGFDLEEFTHGPGYCLNRASAVLLLQTQPGALPRALQAAAAVRASGARLLVVTNQPNADWPLEAGLIPLPQVAPALGCLLSAAAGQFLNYYLALAAGQNPDVAMNDHPHIARLSALMFPKGTH